MGDEQQLHCTYFSSTESIYVGCIQKGKRFFIERDPLGDEQLLRNSSYNVLVEKITKHKTLLKIQQQKYMNPTSFQNSRLFTATTLEKCFR